MGSLRIKSWLWKGRLWKRIKQDLTLLRADPRGDPREFNMTDLSFKPPRILMKLTLPFLTFRVGLTIRDEEHIRRKDNQDYHFGCDIPNRIGDGSRSQKFRLTEDSRKSTLTIPLDSSDFLETFLQRSPSGKLTCYDRRWSSKIGSGCKLNEIQRP